MSFVIPVRSTPLADATPWLYDAHVVSLVLCFLGPWAAARYEVVSRQWQEAATDDALWEAWTAAEFGLPLTNQPSSWKRYFAEQWVAPRQPVLEYIRRSRSWRSVRGLAALPEVEAALARFPGLRRQYQLSREEAGVRQSLLARARNSAVQLMVVAALAWPRLSFLRLVHLPPLVPNPSDPLPNTLMGTFSLFMPTFIAALVATLLPLFTGTRRVATSPASARRTGSDTEEVTTVRPSFSLRVAHLELLDAVAGAAMDEVRCHYLLIIPAGIGLRCIPYFFAIFLCTIGAVMLRGPRFSTRAAALALLCPAALQLWFGNVWFQLLARWVVAPVLTGGLFRQFAGVAKEADPVCLLALVQNSVISVRRARNKGTVPWWMQLTLHWGSLLATLRFGLVVGVGLRGVLASGFAAASIFSTVLT